MSKMLERELNPEGRYKTAESYMQNVTSAELEAWKASYPTKALLSRLEGDMLGILQAQSGGALSQESTDGTAQLYAHMVGQIEAIESLFDAVAGMETLNDS